MNRREFLAGLATGSLVAFSGVTKYLVPSNSVTLETADAFLLTKANPMFEERLKTATFVHKLDDTKFLVWGDDPTYLGELEAIMNRHKEMPDDAFYY